MNFNKNYPIVILDTNIIMDNKNILDILKGCNIVIPYTVIEELDKHKNGNKKENKVVRDFINTFLSISEKSNLFKDGYKLENDCMLYLDIDKNNSNHKEINLDSTKQDIKFIAEAKNLKEKYNNMKIILISSDKIMKIIASIFDVEVKNLTEFINTYIKINKPKKIIIKSKASSSIEASKNTKDIQATAVKKKVKKVIKKKIIIKTNGAKDNIL